MEYMEAMTGTRPFCFIEKSFDYVANDIGNALAPTADDCCLLCVQKEGCHAFSWTNLQGGTCWFKSGRGVVVVNPDVKSSVVLYPGELGSCAVVEEGIDFVGNDIGSSQQSRIEDCCTACDNKPGCHAYTFTAYNGSTCWLKSAKGRTVVSKGARSAAAYGVSQYPSCGLQVEVDFVGNDIGSAKAAQPSDCCAKCVDMAGCRAFSWTNQDGGTCYFKNLLGDTVLKAGVTSVAILPNPPAPSCALEVGVDYVGNDISSARSADAYGCCSLCLQQAGCAAFSWTNANGGTCWLKSGKGADVANADVKSSVVV
uniref:Apple domain-containing protein n=1 Tax=Globisporangium ultimum (strain ATCC 200006 / CBS 805.95 / DAOM BR144) TaxID=431595 RepID=K3WCW1_GLOUD